MKIMRYDPKDPKIKALITRSHLEYMEAVAIVQPILKEVKKRGDEAVIEYTEKFDGVRLTPEEIKVEESEIKDAYTKVEEKILNSIRLARDNIKRFHEEQLRRLPKHWKIEVMDGIEVGEKISAIESVGCYIPGGKASYPSTVLMTAIPAKVAGVEKVVVVTPPPLSPTILVACDMAGVDEVYRVGGAQAIAALAYGTQTIPKVSKIVGPGNKYVLAAKNLIYGIADIDFPAGPSEVLVIADNKANPSWVASDLLAQCEHDTNAQAVLITPSKELIKSVEEEVKKQAQKAVRKEIVEKSIENLALIYAENMDRCIEFANHYAPEHLEIITENPEAIAGLITNAGAIFLGAYAPVVAGDYATGANHVLPTGGAARFASQLSVRDFLKTTSLQKLSKGGLLKIRKCVEELARNEGLPSHAESMKIRFE